MVNFRPSLTPWFKKMRLRETEKTLRVDVGLYTYTNICSYTFICNHSTSMSLLLLIHLYVISADTKEKTTGIKGKEMRNTERKPKMNKKKISSELIILP